ncbi:MAG: class I tRNA ligase family protein, partial [Bacilli bacterium]|nr:class I tRNA ligase family protein [Bacilli bacterium]
KFPHHENERAQSLAAYNSPLANIWMHNGFVNIDNEKMSKSLGNVVLAKDLIAAQGAMVIRMMMLNAHYRAPLNFSDDTLQSSKNELNKIIMCVKQLAVKIQLEKDLNILKSGRIAGFISDLCDDLNVANALSKLYQTIKDANMDLRNPNTEISKLEDDLNDILTMLDVLGLKIDYPVLSNEDKEIYKQYLAFKKEKNFAESDKLRDILIKKNIL